MKKRLIGKLKSEQIQKKSFLLSKFTKGICILLFPLLSFQNCFFNPIVASFLNSNTEEKQGAGFLEGGLLLGLSGIGSSISLTGVIRNGLGEAQTNKVWTVVSSDSNSAELGLTTSGTTDNTGRFFIIVGTGATTIKVTDLGEDLVTFTLQVGGFGMLQATNVDPPEYEIGSLIPYDPSNKPVFFELVSTTPENNSTTYGSGPNLVLTFSDPLPAWEFSQLLTIVNNNVIVSPSTLTFGSTSIDSNVMTIMTNISAFDTWYTIQIGPGITSATGIPVTPTSFRFFSQEFPP